MGWSHLTKAGPEPCRTRFDFAVLGAQYFAISRSENERAGIR